MSGTLIGAGGGVAMGWSFLVNLGNYSVRLTPHRQHAGRFNFTTRATMLQAATSKLFHKPCPWYVCELPATAEMNNRVEVELTYAISGACMVRTQHYYTKTMHPDYLNDRGLDMHDTIRHSRYVHSAIVKCDKDE